MKRTCSASTSPSRTAPPPESLQRIMRDVYALRDEMRSANVWVFSGACTKRARRPS